MEDRSVYPSCSSNNSSSSSSQRVTFVCIGVLHELGLRVGYKALDLIIYRERHNRREIRLLSILTFVATCVWKTLFGHSVELLKAQDSELESAPPAAAAAAATAATAYNMLNDKNLLLNRFISVPRDMQRVNCGAFAAGIIEGILCSAEFPAAVSAHTVEEGQGVTYTTFLIKFFPQVLERQRRLGGAAAASCRVDLARCTGLQHDSSCSSSTRRQHFSLLLLLLLHLETGIGCLMILCNHAARRREKSKKMQVRPSCVERREKTFFVSPDAAAAREAAAAAAAAGDAAAAREAGAAAAAKKIKRLSMHCLYSPSATKGTLSAVVLLCNSINCCSTTCSSSSSSA
ncbi:hypothetical protein Emag_005357 [Eimeria magna]